MDRKTEIRDFLASRRARLTPTQAGLPAYGSNRRVKGLRREEVAMLAGISADYYVRLERGNLRGVSQEVLDGSPVPCSSTKPSARTCTIWHERRQRAPQLAAPGAARRRNGCGRTCSRSSTCS